ncbi:efflux RND transporter permease subunit [Verticiella alkaliphila]|uniref:efflux RND transporter permease subunit n=1 Tax=Verticiella alkaliphila TaxID=2779529 RepID=UPI001C0D630E
MPPIAEIVLRRRMHAWLLALVCLVGGAVAFFSIGQLEDPEFTIKEAIVVTQYPGASANEVATQVTEVIENAIQQLPQSDEVVSRSLPGYSEVRVLIRDEFRGDELTQIWDELRRRVDAVMGDLPPGAGPPQVNDDFGDVYGMYYVLTGEGLTLAEMREAAKQLRRGLLAVDGVSKVEIAGATDEEIVVEVDEARLAALRLSPDELAQALANADSAVESGSVRAGALRLRVSPTGAFDSLEALRALPVGAGGQRLALGDFATVTRGYPEQPALIVRYDGQPALTLGVSGVSGANIVDVGEAVDAEIDRLLPRLPLGVELQPLYAQHTVVAEATAGFVRDMFIAVAIVVVTLCLAMGWRAGVVIGGVLVFTLGGTFLLMFIGGIELQRVSLGALVIAMTMMVDNTVVVCDGILVRLRQGKRMGEACQGTLDQTLWPLFGATLIGILAFAGIGLSQDTTGEFLFSLFWVICSSLLLSWILAMTLVPLLASHLFRRMEREEADDEADPYDGPWYARFRRLLQGALRRRGWLAAGLAVLTAGCVFLFGMVPQSMFPASTTPLMYVDMTLHRGTDIRATEARAAEMATFLAEQDGVTSVATFVGAGATRFMLTYAPQRPDPAFAHFVVQGEDYARLDDLTIELNQRFHDLAPDAYVHATRPQFGPNPDALIEARFIGESPSVLREIAAEARRRLDREAGLLAVRDDWREPDMVLRPQLELTRMAELGVTRQAVGAALQMATDGAPQSVFRDGDELIPIMLRTRGGEGAEDLLQRQVWSATQNRYVPLSQVADAVVTDFEDAIVHRRDRLPTITVLGEPLPGELASQAQARIQPLMEAIPLPDGYRLEWGGEHEVSSDANAALMQTLLLPYLGMFLITVLLYPGWRQPVVIWLVLPMTICGVSLGLLASGLPFGFMALLGLLGLTGMLLKNAIVLVDEIDRQIDTGKPRLAAIVAAGASRLRPVLMVALTTILGVVPLLFDPFFANMAVTIMAGLAFATLLILLAVPVFYAMLARVGADEC